MRIGILEMASPDPDRLALWEIFKRRLEQLGYSGERAVMVDYRWAEGRHERLAGAAAELVASKVDILVTAGTPAAAAASGATAVIPIVMATGVGLRTQLMANAAKPNDNMTGVSDLPPGLSEQRLLRLRTMVGAEGLAILADQANPSSPLAVQETRAVAQSTGLTVRDYWVRGPQQIDEIIAAMRGDGTKGFVVSPGAMFFAHRQKLAQSAAERGLATMAVRREYVEAGCLMSYGSPIQENYLQAAVLVARILQGTKPADIPVAEPDHFDFIFNMTTSRKIGLKPSQTALSGAEIIGGHDRAERNRGRFHVPGA